MTALVSITSWAMTGFGIPNRPALIRHVDSLSFISPEAINGDVLINRSGNCFCSSILLWNEFIHITNYDGFISKTLIMCNVPKIMQSFKLSFTERKGKCCQKDTSLRLVQYFAHIVERNVENIIIRNRQYRQHSLAFPNQKQSVCWRGCLIHTCLNVCKTVY